jgi:hypothetical protein
MSEAAAPGQEYFPWRAVCGVAVLVLTLSVMALAQSNHVEDDPVANQVLSGGAFGYGDNAGRQVIVPVETGLARGMKGFRKAVAVPGRVVDLAYAGVQRGGEADRSSPASFGDTAGAVFAASEPVGPGGDVLVATEEFLAGRRVLAVTPFENRECPGRLRDTLAERAGRPVAWCRDVGKVEGGGVLTLARFAPRGREELVTLAYADADGAIFLDYPGNADPGGTWRADDGGEFPVEGYRPLFAFRTGAGLELAVRWSGTEGEAMNLYRQEGRTFVPFVAASWYHPDE